MSIRKSFIVIALAFVAATTTANAASHNLAPSRVSRMVLTVREALDSTLTDYPSARFRYVKFSLYDDDSGGVACGFVNSKNSSGGYVGWVPFTVIGPAAIVGNTDVLAEVITHQCADPTLHWLPGDYTAQVSARRQSR
jgi:hypothetical protein